MNNTTCEFSYSELLLLATFFFSTTFDVLWVSLSEEVSDVESHDPEDEEDEEPLELEDEEFGLLSMPLEFEHSRFDPQTIHKFGSS